MKTKVQELMMTGCGDILEELTQMDDDQLARTKGGIKTVAELVDVVMVGRRGSAPEQYIPDMF